MQAVPGNGGMSEDGPGCCRNAFTKDSENIVSRVQKETPENRIEIILKCFKFKMEEIKMKKCRALLLVLVGIIVLGFSGCSGNTSVNLMDYVQVEFSGVDGQGRAVCTMDLASLEKTLAGDQDGEISMEELSKLAWITQFETSITCELDQETGLSNGDKIKVTVACSEDVAKQNHFAVTAGTKEFEVSGLKEPVEVDPFDTAFFGKEDGVNLTYDNASPAAFLSIKNLYKSEPQSLIYYTADKISDLSNGDSVTVTAQLPESAVQQGYVLTQTQTTLTVEGLDTYVTSLSQLNDADRKEIETKLTQFFNKTLENGTGLNVGTGNNTGISNRDGVSCTNLAFDNTVYDTSKQGVTIIPFTLDIEGSFYWWGSDFYADKIKKSIPNACGFFTIPGLKIDKDGNVVDIDDLYIEEGGFFVDKDLMEDEILSQFGV